MASQISPRRYKFWGHLIVRTIWCSLDSGSVNVRSTLCQSCRSHLIMPRCHIITTPDSECLVDLFSMRSWIIAGGVARHWSRNLSSRSAVPLTTRPRRLRCSIEGQLVGPSATHYPNLPDEEDRAFGVHNRLLKKTRLLIRVHRRF